MRKIARKPLFWFRKGDVGQCPIIDKHTHTLESALGSKLVLLLISCASLSTSESQFFHL